MSQSEEIQKLESHKQLLEMNIRIEEKKLKDLRIERRKVMQKIYRIEKSGEQKT